MEEMQMEENGRTVTQIENDVDTWVRHGDEAMFKGDFEKALLHYDKALESQSNSPVALHSKANALEALGKYDEALKFYDSALKCDPGDAECWFNKGVMLKKLGQKDEGKKCIDNGVYIAMGSG
jgi:tetratricopeptide (TPR) repeat protein